MLLTEALPSARTVDAIFAAMRTLLAPQFSFGGVSILTQIIALDETSACLLVFFER